MFNYNNKFQKKKYQTKQKTYITRRSFLHTEVCSHIPKNKTDVTDAQFLDDDTELEEEEDEESEEEEEEDLMWFDGHQGMCFEGLFLIYIGLF